MGKAGHITLVDEMATAENDSVFLNQILEYHYDTTQDKKDLPVIHSFVQCKHYIMIIHNQRKAHFLSDWSPDKWNSNSCFKNYTSEQTT